MRKRVTGRRTARTTARMQRVGLLIDGGCAPRREGGRRRACYFISTAWNDQDGEWSMGRHDPFADKWLPRSDAWCMLDVDEESRADAPRVGAEAMYWTWFELTGTRSATVPRPHKQTSIYNGAATLQTQAPITLLRRLRHHLRAHAYAHPRRVGPMHSGPHLTTTSTSALLTSASLGRAALCVVCASHTSRRHQRTIGAPGLQPRTPSLSVVSGDHPPASRLMLRGLPTTLTTPAYQNTRAIFSARLPGSYDVPTNLGPYSFIGVSTYSFGLNMPFIFSPAQIEYPPGRVRV
ncbi:hypothetical protein HYPSUDRAFT_207395 [Hypholoma sublateritium FD-334 SS-4]|uniref:Uncharacterized protein n=1 Tax=Hypholoma sublateritium (strain FD-334 SS-4) TaxID=945553 RepID=A0A0D2KMY8_HYPSF|nr:hypothetical protein HYPSUDRAFT_207395 [Hypholoma sublateritium FD-334 SS-4]